MYVVNGIILYLSVVDALLPYIKWQQQQQYKIQKVYETQNRKVGSQIYIKLTILSDY